MGSRERPLVTKPPRRFRSTRWANSRPYPKVPLAARIGFRRRNAPIFTLRSTAPAELTSPERIARSRYTHAKCGERAGDRFDRVLNAQRPGPDAFCRSAQDRNEIDHLLT